MKNGQPLKINTIAEYHQYMGLAKPQHPLISVIPFEDIIRLPGGNPIHISIGFYSIGLKKGFHGIMRYGQQTYDFDSGVMTFMAPAQVLSIETEERLQHTGFLLLFHPDFLWNTPFAKTIKQYEFFNYTVNEALHLSEKEEAIINTLIQSIAGEYDSNIDRFTQDVIIRQIELLLTYADRFYNRQFITRKMANHQILDRLETLLTAYFKSNVLSSKGLPTVQYIADELNMSANYLSTVLKVLTGQSTQQHIHDKIIEKAKEQLSTTNLSVSEIAYELGFEHSQSFSKLFKSKTKFSPSDFRSSFN